MNPSPKKPVDVSEFENPYITPEEKAWIQSDELTHMLRASLDRDAQEIKEREERHRKVTTASPDALLDQPTAPIERERKSFLSRIRSALFGPLQPKLRRGRREQSVVPAQIQILPGRIMMSGTGVDIDSVSWGVQEYGAEASMQVVPGMNTYDLGLNADGTRLAAAVQDGTIRVMNAGTGTEVGVLQQGGMAMSVEYSPDGSRIATTGYDKTLKIWNAQTLELERSIGIPNLGNDVKWSPDGTMVGVTSAEHSLRIINPNTGAVIREIPAVGDTCKYAFLGNTKIAVSASNVMNVYDIASGNQLHSLEGLNEIYAATASADGSLILAGDNSGQAALWNTQTGQRLWREGGHGPVRGVGITEDNRHMAVGGYGGRLVLRDITPLSDGGQPVIVQEYATRQMPQSIIFTPGGTKMILVTSHSGADSRMMLYNTPIVAEEPPAPEPEEEDPPSQNSELANALLHVQENLSTPVYGRTFATAEIVPESNNALFKIRFSNPGDATHAVVWIRGSSSSHAFSEVITHEGGTADSTWEFVLGNTPDNIGEVEITLYTDEARNIVLDQIRGYYGGYPALRALINTEQIAWDDPQEGMMESEPITPSMSVVKITGNNILLNVQSPYDQSVVSFCTEGMLATQRLEHDGGSPFELSTITFNGALPTGDYTLCLFDREQGKVLDTVIFHWDKTVCQLSVVNSGDMMASEAAAGVDTSTFNAMIGFATANLDDPQFNWIQQVSLYQRTDSLSASYNFFVDASEDLMSRIFAVHPEYHPDNWITEIEARVQAAGPNAVAGHIADSFHNERIAFEHTMRNNLGYYEQEMGEIMQTAVNILIQIRQGGNERYLLETVMDPLIAAAKQEQHIAQLVQIGIHIPQRWDIMNAAKQVFDIDWRSMQRREVDLGNYRIAQERFRDEGLRQNALGEWVAVSPNTGIQPDEGMSEREIRLAARIRGVLATSNDPRVVAYNNLQKDMLAVKLGKSLKADDSLEVLSEKKLVAEAGTVDVTMVSLDPSVNLSIDFWTPMRQRAASESTSEHLNELERFAFRSEGQLSVVFGNSNVRVDTEAGRILLGIAPVLRNYRSAEWSLARLCLRVEQVFGIDAVQLYGLSKHATDSRFAAGLVSLFTQAGYKITETPPVDRTLPTSLIYSDNGVRVVVTSTGFKNPSHARLNITSNGTTIENAVPWKEGAFFVDISASTFQVNAESSIKAVLWFEGEGDSTTLFNNVNIDTSRFTPTISNLNLSVTSDPIENAILNQIIGNPPVHTSDGTWIAYIGSNKHDSDAFEALDINLPGDADRGKEILAMADGIISTIDMDYGTIIIDHLAVGNAPAWQSKYHHSPLRLTGETAENGKPKYGFADAHGNIVSGMRIWEGKSVAAGNAVGLIAGRGTVSDSDFGPHNHVEALYKGQSINLVRVAEQHWGIDVRADDGNQGIRDVQWNQNLSTSTQQGFYVNATERLIFFRDQTNPEDSQSNYWVAWEVNVPIEQMQKLKWDATTSQWYAIDANGNILTNAEGKKKVWLNTSANDSQFIWQ